MIEKGYYGSCLQKVTNLWWQHFSLISNKNTSQTIDQQWTLLSVAMVKIITTLSLWGLLHCEMLLCTKVLLTEQSLGVHHMRSPTGSNLWFHRKQRERGWPVECIQLAEHPSTQGMQGRTAHFTCPWTPHSLMLLISELTPEEGKGSRTLVLITDGRNICP